MASSTLGLRKISGAEIQAEKHNRFSFGPQAVNAMGEAFDAAWAKIARHFTSNPMHIEAARLQLAIALLAVASEDGNSVQMLRDAALQRMGLDDHPSRHSASRRLDIFRAPLFCWAVSFGLRSLRPKAHTLNPG